MAASVDIKENKPQASTDSGNSISSRCIGLRICFPEMRLVSTLICGNNAFEGPNSLSINKGEYYMPSTDGPLPGAILLHGIGGLGERDVMSCKLLVRDLAKRGVASFILQLVVPGQRAAEGTEGQCSMPVIDSCLELYQVLVIKTRKVIDWSEGRNDLNAQRVIVMGISMAGIWPPSPGMASCRP